MGISFYRPRSEASEGYVFTGICLSKSRGEWGGGDHGTWSPPSPPTWDLVTTPALLPPGTWSPLLPLPTWDLVTTPPPTLDLVTTIPTPPGTWSPPCPPPWTWSPPPPPTWDLVTAPPNPPIRSRGRRYVSYWNVFLFIITFRNVVYCHILSVSDNHASFEFCLDSLN